MNDHKKHITDDDHQYLHGKKNFAFRCYFYLMNGLNVMNEFRNLFLGIIALYITLKLTNPLWMAGAVIPMLIILMVLGRFNVHRLSKMGEWLSMRFSTHYGIKSYGFNQRQVELLEEILANLKKQNEQG